MVARAHARAHDAYAHALARTSAPMGMGQRARRDTPHRDCAASRSRARASVIALEGGRRPHTPTALGGRSPIAGEEVAVAALDDLPNVVAASEYMGAAGLPPSHLKKKKRRGN